MKFPNKLHLLYIYWDLNVIKPATEVPYIAFIEF